MTLTRDPRSPEPPLTIFTRKRSALLAAATLAASTAAFVVPASAHHYDEHEPIGAFAGAIEDTFIREARPNSGANHVTHLGAKSVTLNRERIYIKFRVNNVPAGAPITAAALELHGMTGKTSNPDPRLSLVHSNAWSEQTLTWNNKPRVAETAVGYPTTVGARKYYDVRSVVRGPGVYTFALDVPRWTSERALFNSREVTDPIEGANYGPLLRVYYLP